MKVKVLRWLLLPFILFFTSWACGVLSDFLVNHIIGRGVGTLSVVIVHGVSNACSCFLCTILSVFLAPSGKKYIVWIVPLFWFVFTMFMCFVANGLRWFNYVLFGFCLLSSLGGVWVSHKFLIDNKGDK